MRKEMNNYYTMKKIILLWNFLLFTLIRGSGNDFMSLSTITEDAEAKFCFEVKNQTSQSADGTTSNLPPKLALILQVNYPQSIAEAGQIIFDEQDLPVGVHNLSYKYLTTNMTHDLQVWLDDVEKKFLKSEVPRWYSVSTFREVSVLLQGDISILQCLDGSNVQEITLAPKSIVDASFSVESEGKLFFLKDSENSIQNSSETLSSVEDNLSPTTEVKNLAGKGFETTQNLNAFFAGNATETVKSLTVTHSKTKKELAHDKSFASLPAESSAVISSKATTTTTTSTTTTTTTTNNNNNNTPSSIVPINKNGSTGSINYLNMGASLSASSIECLSGNCTKEFRHDYTIALSLLGILCVLVVSAIVISVVFHRKKKKLMALARAKPNNMLRQQIYEEEGMFDAENLLMLKEIDHFNYEEIP